MTDNREKGIFFSKRNCVYLNKKENLVVKEFINEIDYFNEKNIYQKLKKKGFLYVPNIIEENDKFLRLLMSYVNGVTVLEMLEFFEKKNKIENGVMLLDKVLKWLDLFYNNVNVEQDKEKGLALGDVNLRNFICSKDRIYGIDFENCKTRIFEEEKMEVIARYLLYDPIESKYKQKVVDRIISDMVLDESTRKHVRNNINTWMKNITMKRNMYGK